jgi:putative DNA primase/helicase
MLTWAVQGCLDWQREGLQIPEDVKAAANDYRNEMDEVGTFLTECCIMQPNVKANPTDLYDAYKKWCEDTGETVLSQRAFGTRLTERGLKPKQSGGQRYRSGVGLLEKRTTCTA